jgi:hypothetical protein
MLTCEDTDAHSDCREGYVCKVPSDACPMLEWQYDEPICTINCI